MVLLQFQMILRFQIDDKMVKQDKYVMLQNMELFRVTLKVLIEYVLITIQRKKQP